MKSVLRLPLLVAVGFSSAVCHNIWDFCARVLATVVAHYWPPHRPGDSDGILGVNSCRFGLTVAVFPSRRRPRGAS